ncbi:MAG: tyrosine-type recombinase/integrase [Saccharofermentanales bacterium]
MKTNPNLFETLSTRLYELLEAERYSESTVRDMRFILRSMSDFMKINCLEEYSPEIGKRFVAYCVNDLRICPSRISRAKNIVGKLDRLLQGFDGRAALLPDLTRRFWLPNNLMTPLEEYLVYCAGKGNRQSTVDYKDWICNRFLKNLLKLGCTEIRELTGEDVQAAFLALGAIRYWERIGPFLRFLADSNYLKQNYSGLIQHRRHPMPQPTVYSPEEISSIEGSFDLCSPAGIRNYAITLLMSRYGIRACDVAALTFDNIDFENNRLHFIQQKTDDLWEGELFPEIKSALQRYINNVRPNAVACSSIFITLAPPYAPTDNRAINTMIWNQFGRANIDIAARRHGGRVFRSSVASNMINDGISTEVVRRVLGHGTKYALKHYARIDIESMRLCPLPVPEPTGMFANILSGKGGAF